jgi:hypothetical protein
VKGACYDEPNKQYRKGSEAMDRHGAWDSGRVFVCRGDAFALGGDGAMKTYHNTLDLRGPLLDIAKIKARSQQEIILEYFTQCHDVWLTPFEVQTRVLPQAPITSVRRSMTNLTKAGKLRKTHVKVQEKLGAPNHKWRLAGKPRQQSLFWKEFLVGGRNRSCHPGSLAKIEAKAREKECGKQALVTKHLAGRGPHIWALDCDVTVAVRWTEDCEDTPSLPRF